MFYIFAAVAVFAGLYVHGITAVGIFTALFLVLLVACASSDINKGIIPDLVIIWITVLAVIKFIITEPFEVLSIADHLTGAICVSVPMLVVALLLKGAFGGGDIKMMAAAGLFLGWKLVLAGVICGMFFAGLYGVVLLIIRKANMRTKIRIAPFLVFGLSVSALFGDILLRLIFGW